VELEKTRPPLRDFGLWIFGFIKGLGKGRLGQPVYQSGWYRAPPQGKVCLYIRFVGPRGHGHHANSAHLTTLWADEEFAALPWIEKGNNWFGSTSADYYARPDDPDAKVRAEAFIRRAFKVVTADEFLKEFPGIAVRGEVIKVLGDVVDDNRRATSAAKRIKAWLVDAGAAMPSVVREILINVASDAVQRILFGR
jgi:hypothetical protein